MTAALEQAEWMLDWLDAGLELMANAFTSKHTLTLLLKVGFIFLFDGCSSALCYDTRFIASVFAPLMKP